MPARHGAVGIGLVLVLVSACGATPPAGTQPATPATGTSADTFAAVEAALAEANQLEAQVRTAQVQLAVRCMTRQGFTVHPARPPVTTRADALAPPLLSPGLPDARTRGYGIGETVASAEPSPPADGFSRLARADQERYEQAWSRTADGAPWRDGPDGRPLPAGCLGEAYAVLHGAARHGPRNPVTELSPAAQDAYHEHPRLTAALTAWSSCVEQHGQPRFTDPAQAYRYAEHFHYPAGDSAEDPVPAGGPWPFAQARPREIALATADAECADRSGLRQVQPQVWREAVASAYVQLEPQFVAYRDALTRALGNARTALVEA
ncbi:hypothetical protein [Catellatospora bangladeshensis]|uniref:Uncharacterized protein n=1 Tax=Catellatospora bangladeshensis TaxID=310355 RepID=A0A8J3JR59_9ACTN|nr:hypothetical protein [Catellatospora bangladeshensis]GIF82324.1 hypothetical protein Cba03nite_36730 [Catellatospora bangladeshensis]